MSPHTTSVFVVVVVGLFIAFDVYLDLDGIEGNTYSERVRVWARRWRWLPYLIALGFGVLTGHWFVR